MTSSLVGKLPDALSKVHPRAPGQLWVCSPDYTLSRLKPLFGQLGIARLADITDLDRIGIPVVQAICPLAKSLTVKQGKGPSLAQAIASAAMEAAEAWHAENVAAPTESLDIRSGDKIDILGLCPTTKEHPPDTASISWIKGWDFVAHRPIWGPFDSITLDFTVPLQCTSLQRGSNGLASGNTLGEALSHALYEVIERDCIADFERRSPRQRSAAFLPADTLRSYGAGRLIEKIDAAKVVLNVWDITNDLDVPAFRALLYEVGKNGPGTYVHPPKVGYGCHLDPSVALARAITEAAQSRLVAISGARDDLVPADYQPPQFGNGVLVLSSIADAASAKGKSETRASTSMASSEEDAAVLIGRLISMGLNQIVAFDLTNGEFGIPVVRVLVPGLGGLSTGHKSYAGIRHEKR